MRNISWGLYMEEGLLKKYAGTDEDVYIPDCVTGIAKGAFFYKKTVKTVRLPKHAEVNSLELFLGCSQLRTVELPETLQAVGNYMFFNCISLEELSLPEQVTAVGLSAFQNCGKLQVLRLPAGVTRIGKEAFRGCKSLREMRVPTGVTAIESMTFEGCAMLERLELPETVQTIADHVFDGCDRLQYNRYDGCLYLGNAANPYHALIKPEKDDCTAVTVHKDTKLMAEWAFYDCGFLETVTVEGDPKIPASAFLRCDRLRTFHAPNMDPNKLKKAGLGFYCALSYLENRERYPDAEGAALWEKYAFCQKKRLVKAMLDQDIPTGLEFYAENGRITAENFRAEYLEPALAANATACIAYLLDWKDAHLSLQELEKQADRELRKDPYNATDMKKLWDCLKRDDGTWQLLRYKGDGGDVTVPHRIGKIPVTILGPSSFSGWKAKGHLLQTVTIPEGITGVRYDTFGYCGNLELVRIPATVTEIDKHAFDCCKRLTIQAPAGSYAESYAKEMKIPFVEE